MNIVTWLIEFFKLTKVGSLMKKLKIGIGVGIFILLCIAGVGLWIFSQQKTPLDISVSRRFGQRVVEWKPQDNWTYTIERGSDAQTVEEIAVNQTDPLFVEVDATPQQTIVYRVTAYEGEHLRAQSELVVVNGVEDTDGDGLFDDEENTHQTNRYQKDTDSDGLSDYQEIMIYQTNPLEKDSDGDGLDDMTELAWNLNPLKADSDQNGTADGEEDGDADRIINREELALKTFGNQSDSDFDGLSDSRERELKTNPIEMDTDGDGVLDGEEILYQLDPLKRDTNGDGIPDGKEMLNREVSWNSDDTRSTIQSIEVKVPMPASAASTVEIIPLEKEEVFQSNDVPGYLGQAYELTAGERFEQAEVKIRLNPATYGAGVTPRLYYINEWTQNFEEVDNQIVEGAQLAATITHFAKYIVLDKNEVDKAWQKALEANNKKVSVVFVLDVSASMNESDPYHTRIEMTKSFVKRLNPAVDRVGVVTFNNDVQSTLEVSTDYDGLTPVLQSMKNDGGTDGSRGIDEAIKLLMADATGNQRMIVFMTDGKDTSAKYSYDDLIKTAKEQSIKIYTIGLGSVQDELLKKVAASTNGTYMYAQTDGDLAASFSTVSKGVKHTPIQAIRPAPAPVESTNAQEKLLNQVSDEQLLLFSSLVYYSDTLVENNILKYYDEKTKGVQNVPEIGVQKRAPLLSGYRLAYHTSETDKIDMAVFTNQTNAVIVYRGSDSTKDWLDHYEYNFTNLQKYALDVHPQDVQAIAKMRRLFHRYQYKNVYITGHSLGGRQALVANAVVQQNKTKYAAVKKTVTFNALGIKYTDQFYKQAYEDTRNYVVEGEFLSKFGYGAKENIILVKASGEFESANMITKHSLTVIYPIFE